MNFHPLLSCGLFSLLVCAGAFPNAAFAAVDTATVDTFKVAGTYTSKAATDPFGRSLAGITIRYRLFVPKNYNPALKYPIMLTLHGSGEGGTNNRSQLLYRLNRMWADDTVQARQAMFVLAPQSTATTNTWVTLTNRDSSWRYSEFTITPNLEAAIQLYDSIVQAYSIDTTRQYVSGQSAGGYAAYYLLTRFPKRWAAAVQTCACGDSSRAIVNSWINTAIWFHHGSADNTVRPTCSRQMFASLVAAYAAAGKDTAGTMRYSEYAGVNHFSWENASREARLIPWLQGKATPVGIKPRAARSVQGLSPYVLKNPVDLLGRCREPWGLYVPRIFETEKN
jgi:predicted peptidase